MFLILSAAYIDQELKSEFGKIPPSFLPLGNRRLFEHQARIVPRGIPVYLSIPESYNVSKNDIELLEKLSVTLIRIPDGISIGASVVAALNLSAHDLSEPLHILYGDTLFTELPQGLDLISVSAGEDSYNWAVVTSDELHWLQNKDTELGSDIKNIVCGYFKFSSPKDLIRSVTSCGWDFLGGLNLYHRQVGLEATYTEGWLDFGHVNTYYRSKVSYTTQRAFNELSINSKWIEKSSSKSQKIAAESNWFVNLPTELKIFTPQYLGSEESNGRVTYRLEYLHQTALNELYVFGELSISVWERILSACIDFLETCSKYHASSEAVTNSASDLFARKTEARLGEFCSRNGISLDGEWIFNGSPPVSLRTILDEASYYLPQDCNEFPHTILHGDFCFSNILYDFRAERIKTIDPRGALTAGEFSLFGDNRYDIAKLSHSIIGMYDLIIAGYYSVSITKSNIEFSIETSSTQILIQKHFVKLIKRVFNVNLSTLLAMQIHLFLSMLPLHDDDLTRQKALFANAFRLYLLLRGDEK